MIVMVIMGGARVLPDVMMLRTSLSATGSIVRKTSLDCARGRDKNSRAGEFERQTGCHHGRILRDGETLRAGRFDYLACVGADRACRLPACDSRDGHVSRRRQRERDGERDVQ